MVSGSIISPIVEISERRKIQPTNYNKMMILKLRRSQRTIEVSLIFAWNYVQYRPFILCCLYVGFLGLPKNNRSYIYFWQKKGLNILNLSTMYFSSVKSSIDAALAEYIASKNLSLNMQDTFVGNNFEKNTDTRGVVDYDQNQIAFIGYLHMNVHRTIKKFSSRI